MWHHLSFHRVKTLMKKTCLLSVTNGPLSGAAGAGPGYRTLTVCWKITEKFSPPGTACLWEPPPAVRVFWQTSASRRSHPCTAKAAAGAATGASAQRTRTAPTAPAQILQQCQTLLPSQCLTSPKKSLTMAHYLISTARQAASVPKTSWSAWRHCALEELWEGGVRRWWSALRCCSTRPRLWRRCGVSRS